MPSVFYLGATGYIGGSVLVTLLKRYPEWKITALVRTERHVERVRALGVTVVQGSFTDEALVAEYSRASDLVINTAESDNVPLITAILAGMKQRHHEGKPKGTLIHTSGVAIFLDDKRDGKFDPEGKVWNDAREEDIKSITTSMLHGQVDVPILRAGEEGYVNTYVLCPAAIVGAAPTGVPVKNGSFFLKAITQAYLQAQGCFYVGEGTNEFQLVHIEDLVDYYLRVVHVAVEGKDADASPYARYFIVTANPVSWKEIATVVAGALHRRTILDSGTPAVLDMADLDPRIFFVGASERVVAERGEALGWKPRHVELKDYINESIDEVLEGMH